VADNSALAFQIENLLRLYDERRTLAASAPGNPQLGALDDRIAHGVTALREAADATLRTMDADVASFERQIADLRGHLQTFPGKESEFAQLTLESELRDDTYRYLLAQYQAASIGAATIHPYIEIMDAASPARRVGVGPGRQTALGLLVGLVLGVLAAFLLEYVDRGIKTSSDVERAVDIPVLGLIPLGTRLGEGGGPAGAPRRRRAIPLVALTSPEDPSAEAYRALRASLTFVNAEARSLRLLCVTSPGPGAGRSTTAANLAVTLAQQGTHVLLVDADLRRPALHRAFNLVQEPGLTDILVGTATLREAARPNLVANLDVLPAGALPPNPSELLGSAAMLRFLEELRAAYEMVIFDSPPALAAPDAAVLGAATDGVILVLRAGETNPAAARRALELFRSANARVAGAVLNGTEPPKSRAHAFERGGPGRGPAPLPVLRSRIANLL
jgi:tyrosine-protein kinase Etk/Wzc